MHKYSFIATPHQPSLFNFLDPYLTLLTRLNLLKYDNDNAYIATPIYHGYGLAMLFLFISLGKKLVISKGFNAEKACALIREHNVQVVTVVPLMLSKILNNNAEDLGSLVCIASGVATLNPKLVDETFSKLGNVLYNLYGTSEAGLCTLATPQDLRYSAKTIGIKIHGVKLKLLNNYKIEVEIGKVGKFCVKNSCLMKNNDSWLETGDLGYQDSSGCFFLCGGADDEILGQRLKAFVLLEDNSNLTTGELLKWLRSRLARFQLPKEIVFVDSIPFTPLGKPDKKQLK